MPDLSDNIERYNSIVHEIECDRCETTSSVKDILRIEEAVEYFENNGWSYINSEILCPTCANSDK